MQKDDEKSIIYLTDADLVCEVIRKTLSTACTPQEFFKVFLDATNRYGHLALKDYKRFLDLICEMAPKEELEIYKKNYISVVVDFKQKLQEQKRREELLKIQAETKASLSERFILVDKEAYRPKEFEKIQESYDAAIALTDALGEDSDFEADAQKIIQAFDKKMKKVKISKKVKNRNIMGILFAIMAVIFLVAILFIGAIPTVQYRATGETTYTVKGISGLYMPFHFPMRKVIIDEKKNGGTVVEISEYAFRGENIETVILPASISTIETGAFEGCRNLKNILMSPEDTDNSLEQVSTILDFAFSGCSKLEDVIISSKIKRIDTDAFSSCSPEFKIRYKGTEASWEEKALDVQANVVFMNYTISVEGETKQVLVVYGESFYIGQPSSGKTGYYFTGYSYEGTLITDALGFSLEDFKYDKDITVQIEYEPKEYTISYQISGEKRSYGVKYAEMFTLPIPSETTEDGVFIGWYYRSTQITDATGKALEKYIFLYSIDVEAKYNKSFNVYTNKQIKVNFETNVYGMTLPSQTLSSNNTTLVYPEIPKRNRYVFAGWYIDASLQTPFHFTETLTEDITLYAKWIAAYDDVIYLNEGVKAEASKFFAFYPLVSQTITVYTTGNTSSIFVEIQDKNKERLNRGNYPITYDVEANTLYYIGVVSSYVDVCVLYVTGSYDRPASTAKIPEMSVTYGKDYNLTFAQEKGKTFLGYYLDADFKTKLTDENGDSLKPWTFNEDKVVYPKYELIQYSITYATYGGSFLFNYQAPFIYTVTTPTIYLGKLSKNGHTFDGWYTSPEFEGEPITEIVMGSTGNLKLYAKYTPITYTAYIERDDVIVTFNSNEGSPVPSQTLTVSNPILSYPDIPTRKGYIFAGWYTDASLQTFFNFTETLTEDITLYAKWIAVDDDVIYLNEGVKAETSKFFAFYPLVSQTITVYTTSSVSSVFVEIQDKNKERLRRSQSLTYDVKANTLYYIGVVSSYVDVVLYVTGSYDRPASTAKMQVLTVPVTYGKDYNLTFAQEKGKTFLGYYLDADFKTKLTDENGDSLKPWIFNEDKIVYPKYELMEYSITYNCDDILSDFGPSESHPESYTVITPTITLVTVSKVGYTFDWYTSPEFEGEPITEIVMGSTGDLKLYAKYTPITYTAYMERDDVVVTFDSNGGSSVASQTLTLSNPVLSFPDIPTRTGYTFLGWYTDEACTTIFHFDEAIPTDMTLYAKWTQGAAFNNSSMGIMMKISSESSDKYYLYYARTTHQIAIYSTGSVDTYGYLCDANKSTILYDDDSGEDHNFRITYTVEANTLYYIRFGVRSDQEDTCTIRVEGTEGDAFLSTAIVEGVYYIKYDSQYHIPPISKTGYTFKGWYYNDTQLTDENGDSLSMWLYTTNIPITPRYELESEI